MSKTLCAIPWNHLSIQQNGDFRACCQCIHAPGFGKLKNDDGSFMNVVDTSFDEARNSYVLKDMRASMMRGEQPEVCKLCWDDEKSGFYSRRFVVNKIYGLPDVSSTATDGTIDVAKNPIQYMDIRFGNLCNQACRSCGPSDSSLWVEESAKVAEGFDFYDDRTYKFGKKGKTWVIKSNDFEWYKRPDFQAEFEKTVKTIDRLYFTGGEPTVNKAHFKTLDLLIERGQAKHVTLEYNSNVMAIPDHLIERWSHFNSVEVGASVDGYGELANYVRWPSEWESIKKNLLRLDEDVTVNMNIGISSTISILNVLNFIDMVKWHRENKFKRLRQNPVYHVLHGPSELSLQILPPDLKVMITREYGKFFAELGDQNLIKYFLPIVTFMNEGKYDEGLFRKFFHRMNQMDEHRQQKLTDVLPWLSEWHARLI